MNKLSKEKVLHVASLAKLKVKDEEINKYGLELGAILNEIDKINNVIIPDNLDILISPTDNIDCYSTKESDHLNKKDIFRNAHSSDEDFIIVPGVIK